MTVKYNKTVTRNITFATTQKKDKQMKAQSCKKTKGRGHGMLWTLPAAGSRQAHLLVN